RSTKKRQPLRKGVCVCRERIRDLRGHRARQEFGASREELALTGEQCGLVGAGGITQRVKGKPDNLRSSNIPQPQICTYIGPHPSTGCPAEVRPLH
ncbi:mCG1036931, isoform CRA_b, partial [Mus musculus]